MQELIRNAWHGWRTYTDDGKLAALFLAAILLLWLWKSLWKSENEKDVIIERYYNLILYATVLGVCCICPFTAAVLMAYQTRFYDYQWIWSMVPVTIVIALAGTLVWTELSGMTGKKHVINPRTGKRKVEWWSGIKVTAIMLVLLYLCGSVQEEIWRAGEEAQKREKTAQVLEILTKNGDNNTIHLWAPREIMEYARALDGRVILPYGRNMWDKALNAYSYDTYGEAEEKLYTWMTYVEETGESEAVVEVPAIKQGSETDVTAAVEGSVTGENTEKLNAEPSITAKECMQLARELGVTHILLPGNLEPGTLAEIEQCLGVRAEQLLDYYFVMVP